MNSKKHSLVFFSAGVIVILGLVLTGIIPMSMTSGNNIVIMPESRQNPTIHTEFQIQLQENDPQNSLQEEEDDGDNSSENNSNINIAKPIEEMSCTELNKLIMSFEKGWGAAIPLYDEKCL